MITEPTVGGEGVGMGEATRVAWGVWRGRPWTLHCETGERTSEQ